MTTTKDNFQNRVGKLGQGLEDTQGVPRDGMQDPTGEFPKREYNYGPSINKAARGLAINELYVGGGEVGVSLGLEPQRASEFPFNQVEETTSGHVVEYDDTPGGERILIKHRKGAGVEMRADGSVIISAVNNKVEVTGGDQTLIVEGHGNMIYNGNLNLTVKGDYNVDVAGNYSMNVAGNSKEQVRKNKKTKVVGSLVDEVSATRSTRTVGRRTDYQFDDYQENTIGDKTVLTEGALKFHSDDTILMTGKNQFAVTSKNTNITGAEKVSVLGARGSIGGQFVDFTAKVYMGPLGPTPFASGATFYGNVMGQSLEAINAQNATNAVAAATAGTAAVGPANPGLAPLTLLVTPKTSATAPDGPPITAPIVAGHSLSGTYAIRNVTIDAKLADRINYSGDYKGIFDHRPSTQEIRSAFRSTSNRTKIATKLVAEGRLSADYSKSTPPKIGRVVGKAAKGRFGFTPIGNALENRGKRFK